MRKLKTLLSVLIILVVLAYALAFSSHNSQPIALDFLIGDPVNGPAALWLGLVLMTGALLGFFSGALIQARQKLRIRRLSKELQDTKQRLSKLP